MTNVSIYSKNWIDLVFENKNKEYGAYKLRQENAKTTMTALLLGILFIFSIIGLGIVLSSFNEKPIEPAIPIDSPPIITVDMSHSPVSNPLKSPKTSKPKTQTESQKSEEPTNLSHMVVAATPEAKADVPTNDFIEAPQISGDSNSGTSDDSSLNGGNGVETTVDIPSNSDNNKPLTSYELDRLPQFPGGIKKFYDYLKENIERQEVNDSYTNISVYLSFVIEKDGTISNIKAIKSTDYNLEKEAIRVLKSLKSKWIPGIKDGKNVRTMYTLPIKVAM